MRNAIELTTAADLLKFHQIWVNRRIKALWNAASAYEEASANSISNMLLYLANFDALNGLQETSRLVKYIETLFLCIDSLDQAFRKHGLKSTIPLEETRTMLKSMVGLMSLLHSVCVTKPDGDVGMNRTEPVFDLVTKLTQTLKGLLKSVISAAVRIVSMISIMWLVF